MSLYLGDILISGSFKSGASWEVGDVGISAFGIDEALNKRRYLNGQVISQAQFVQFTAMLKSRVSVYPSLATSEVNWQATVTNSDLGQCGQFVIDDVAGTIRLPKVVNINGLQNLALLGGIKAESLPNITGSLVTISNNGDFTEGGCFTYEAGVGTTGKGRMDTVTSTQGNIARLSVNASNSSSTYQDDAPVQQEAVQYPYFIQVAEGVENSVDVSREIELNNPFSLLQYMYSEYEISNASWLISNGQYNSGATYPAVYNLLLTIYNGTTTKAGVSVKLSTEVYTDTDFVLNTGDTTFRLPIKVRLPNSKGVAGNGMKVGIRMSNEADDRYLINTNRVQNGVCISGNQNTSTDFSISPDTTKSGIEVKDDSSMYLYFYVGETVQDANIIAASNALTDIADLKAHSIVETYVNGTSWYRIYSDGWCEQGGHTNSSGAVNLLKSYRDINYSVTATILYTGYTNWGVGIKKNSVSQINVNMNIGSQGVDWQAFGYIS